MRVLEEFWYGNINPVEIPFQRQRQFDKVFKLLTKNEEKLLETLNEQEKELFDKYKACQKNVIFFFLEPNYRHILRFEELFL